MNPRKLGTMGSVIGVVLATAFGWIATDSAPVNPLHLVDNMGGDPPSLIYWVNGRVDSDYTGALFNVRRSSGSPSTTDIGFIEETNLYDSSALSTFCSGVNCFVVTVYDQSGNGIDATQATTTAQPKIWDSVTGAITCSTAAGTELCFQTADTTDLLTIANHGFTGAPALTVAITVDDERTVPLSSNVGFFSVGANTVGSFTGWTNSSTQHYAFVSTTTSTRWTRLSGLVGLTSQVFSLPASGTRSTATLRSNGVLNGLTPTVTGDDVTTLSLSAAGSTSWGRGASTLLGKYSFFAVWQDVLSGARLDALNTWLAAHRADQDRALIVAGQSNGSAQGTSAFIADEPPQGLPANFATYANVSVSGTCLSAWEQGDPNYNNLLAQINAHPAGIKVVIWWIQGECDAASLGSTYETSFRAMWDDLVADSGRTLYLIDTLLHDDLFTVDGRVDTELVNTAKIDNCTDLGASICAYLDPDDYPLPADTTDGVHHNTDLQNALRADMYPLADAF